MELEIELKGRIAWLPPGFVYIGDQDVNDWITENFHEGKVVSVVVREE